MAQTRNDTWKPAWEAPTASKASPVAHKPVPQYIAIHPELFS
jgi:hypothetical protein